MKKIILYLSAFLTGCVPTYIHYHKDPITIPIKNGTYTFCSTDYIYWGYTIRLEVKDSIGLADIKDVGSTFTATDTLKYRKTVDNASCEEFSGRYLSFIRSNKKWIMQINNPVSGSRFIGYTDKLK